MLTSKLLFQAYEDEQFRTRATAPHAVFLNPESFVHSTANAYNQPKVPGTAGVFAQFTTVQKDTLSFTLTLDGTRPIDGRLCDVTRELQALRDLLYKYQGKIHHPYYVQVVWGTFIFNGVLTSFNTTYSLFKPDGSPLRAKLSLTFIGFTDATMRELQARKQSPDLTHRHIVQAGDTLPQLCYERYGDVKYYLQVAKFNNILNISRLQPGSVLIFPPVR